VLLYLLEQKGMSGADVQGLLYRECGLKGLSGISNDVRELEASSDPVAGFALDYFCYRAGLYAGMLASALEGLDTFVFTAGIGENSASIHSRIAARLGWLGVELDPAANAAHAIRISRENSCFALYVIPTDEELMIARHTVALLPTQNVEPRSAQLARKRVIVRRTAENVSSSCSLLVFPSVFGSSSCPHRFKAASSRRWVY
jgi:acetate kinase